jgi:hypothetical protein
MKWLVTNLRVLCTFLQKGGNSEDARKLSRRLMRSIIPADSVFENYRAKCESGAVLNVVGVRAQARNEGSCARLNALMPSVTINALGTWAGGQE